MQDFYHQQSRCITSEGISTDWHLSCSAAMQTEYKKTGRHEMAVSVNWGPFRGCPCSGRPTNLGLNYGPLVLEALSKKEGLCSLQGARVSESIEATGPFDPKSQPNGSRYLYSTYIGPRVKTWELL